LTTMPASTASSRLQSCTFAPLTTSDNGTPRPSTSRWRLLPFFSPIRRVGADGFLRQWRLHHRAVNALPSPRDPLHLVVLGQPRSPQRLKEAGFFPFEESLVDGTRAAKALLGERPPLAAGAQHIDDGFEHQSSRLRWPSGPRLAQVDLVCHRAWRNQRFHPLPELIGNDPRLDTLGQGLNPTPRSMRLRLVVYLFTDKFLWWGQ